MCTEKVFLSELVDLVDLVDLDQGQPINQSWFNTSWGVFPSNIGGLLLCVSKSDSVLFWGSWDNEKDLSTATFLDMRTGQQKCEKMQLDKNGAHDATIDPLFAAEMNRY